MFEIENTIAYYNSNAKDFAAGTISVAFEEMQKRFLDKLPEQAYILDFGCGSGRDTKYFLTKGCRVEAVDGSLEMCRLAGAYTGIHVRHMLFQDLEETERYDGIWACASILHLPKDSLRQVMKKMGKALQKNGIIYASFKYGDFQGERNGRFFTDMTEKSFADFLDEIENLQIVEQWTTSDVRPGRGNEKWLNLILQKI
ncbi:MAG: class I SAM-dependent methyltransferase [Lachnospiraceae bacterium]|nr:class I SAM-dependent methyltransferase [Lachnospiraceae bacterium]